MTDDLAAQVGRPSIAGQDHLGRTRAAATLVVPRRNHRSRSSARSGPYPTDRRVAGIAARVLAAAGPQTLDPLHAAITRSRRDRPAPIDADPAGALHTLGAAPDETGRWLPHPAGRSRSAPKHWVTRWPAAP